MEHATTVFIADSAEDFCTGLASVLQHADGFHVVGTALDGEQAVRMIEDRRPEVLVLDLMLPKKDGISVLKALQRLNQLIQSTILHIQSMRLTKTNLVIQTLYLQQAQHFRLVRKQLQQLQVHLSLLHLTQMKLSAVLLNLILR